MRYFDGRILRQLREAAGLTQMELAVKVELSLSGYTKLELGQVKGDPGYDTVCKLADTLGCSADAFRGKPAAALENVKRTRRRKPAPS
jgi:transcriptional regulator with XRE-family HTH domain